MTAVRRPARVLITNDDGVSSPGIHELARQIAANGHDVLVVAPDHDASGTGASLGRISPDHPIKVTQTAIAGLAAPAYSIAGPPALCVVVGNLEVFGARPDIVVSGINAGLNTGRSALHSGTIGAALAAQNFGIRGLSVSLASASQWYWQTAAAIAVDMIPAVLEGPERGLMNLNVPALPADRVKGIRWAGLADFGSVAAAISGFEDGHLHFHHEQIDQELEWDTDLATVRAGFAAVTSIHGPTEVWGPERQSGHAYEDGQRVDGACAGHQLRPSRSYLN